MPPLDAPASTAPPDGTAAIEPDMFQGSARLGPVLGLLRRLPRPASEGLLAALAVGDGIVRGRFRDAVRWSAAQGAGAWGSAWMATRLLANHGRYAAAEAMIGIDEVGDVAEGVVITGREHLDIQQGGAMLLGFHLGPPRAWLALRVAGYRVRMVARFENVKQDRRWDDALASSDLIRMSAESPSARVGTLYRIRRLLSDNALIYMTGDGPFGREAFRIDLPGNPLVVRTGWLALRRQTRVPTVPVFMHEESGRRVIELHPPLPAVQPDAAADAEACRAALTPIVADYVQRFPAQCRWLAFPPWAP